MSDDVRVVAEALSLANNPHTRRTAESYLGHCELSTPGFYSILQRIYLSEKYEENTRVLAAISFKNGVDKYWRKTAINAISEDQKVTIRSLLFEGSRNVPSSVARQNSIAVARIARTDFPSEWPNLFEDLLHVMTASHGDEALLCRQLQILHQIVKTLCSLRLAWSRTNFQKVSPDTFTFVVQLYNIYSARWLGNSNSNNFQCLEISDLGLKIARRLICYGFETPYRETSCRDFFTVLSDQIPLMWEDFTKENRLDNHTAITRKMVSKNLLHAGKLFLELSANSMQNYALNYNYVLMPGSMALVKTYWNLVVQAATTTSEDIKKVIIQGLILLKQCIKLAAIPQAHLGLVSDQESVEIEQALRLLKAEIFSTESVMVVLEKLITLYFVLKEEDVAAWETNAEDWMIAQEDDHWQFALRPCAERVFVDLFAQFKQILTQPLLQVLDSTFTAQSGQPMLLKEAMYSALGLAASHLYDQFDFDDFLPLLEREIQVPDSPSIFKRRILVLISQWVSVKCKDSSRPTVYAIVGTQLQNTNTGLRLSAAICVHKIIDIWDWNIETFKPFSAHYIRSLIECLALAEEIEIKMRILAAIGIICERMGPYVGPELEVVLSRIPREWQESEDQHMIKVALLGLLNRIVIGQKQRSTLCYPIVLPLIQYSTDAANPEHIYLLEEALELWHAVLQNATEPNTYLLQLFPILLAQELLPSATDNLGKILYIIESSLLLLSDMIDQEGLGSRLIDDMLSMLASLSSDALSQFTRVLGFCASLWGPRCFTPDNIWKLSELALTTHENPIVDVCILSLISHIIVRDASYVLEIWMKYRQGDMTRPVIDRLVARFDNIGHPKHRKLCAMALTAMVSTRHPVFIDADVLASLGTVWGDVLAEVQSVGDDLVYWAEDSALLENLEVDTPEIARRATVNEHDPVYTTHLKTYIKTHVALIDRASLGVNLDALLSD